MIQMKSFNSTLVSTVLLISFIHSADFSNHEIQSLLSDELVAVPVSTAGTNSSLEIECLGDADGEDVFKSDDVFIIIEGNLLSADDLTLVRDEYGMTALHRAAAARNAKSCNYIISLGVRVDHKDSAGYFPLHWASKNGH